MLGAYFGATALRSYSGLNIWVAALGAGICGLRRSAGCSKRLVLTRLKSNPLGQVLVTLGMSFIISDACLMLWGGDPIPVPTPQGPAIADAGLRLRISDLSAGAGRILDRRCHHALCAAGADAAGCDDPGPVSTTGRWPARSVSLSLTCLPLCFVWAPVIAGAGGVLGGPVLVRLPWSRCRHASTGADRRDLGRHRQPAGCVYRQLYHWIHLYVRYRPVFPNWPTSSCSCR